MTAVSKSKLFGKEAVFGYLEQGQEYWNKEYCRVVLLIFIGRIQFMAGNSIRCLM